MTYTFAVDLAELQGLADVDLQDLANIYDKLNHAVAGTADNDRTAFVVYPAGSGGVFEASGTGTGTDSMFGSWTALRDQLCNFLAHTSTNYQAAVTAMHHIIAIFAETDRVSAADIQAVRDHENKSDGDSKVTPDSGPVIIR